MVDWRMFFVDTVAAITTASYGSESATMIGTMLGAASALKSDESCADLIHGLASELWPALESRLCKSSPRYAVRVDVLTGADRRWIMAENLTSTQTEAFVELGFPLSGSPVEVFSGELAALHEGKMRVSLLPGQIKGFWDNG